MKRSANATVLCLLPAACGGSGPISVPSSGQKVIIVEAPTATFDAFLPMANAVLESVRFA